MAGRAMTMPGEKDRIVESLHLLEFFPLHARERVAACCREETYQFGEVIVREGDPGDAFFILVEGKARVYKRGDNGEDIPLNVLGPGDEFGEIALLEEGTRTASVRCSSEVRLYRLDRADFHRLLADDTDLRHFQQLRIRHRKLHNFLRESSGFSAMPPGALQAFLEGLTPTSFASGEVVVREGEESHEFYIVEEGRLRAHVLENGQERNVAFLRSGDYFGEASTIRKQPRGATVQAVSDCRLLAMQRAALESIMAAHPEVRAMFEARIASYAYRQEAKVPLDFSQELLPADALAHAVDLDSAQEGAESEVAAPRKGRYRPSRWLRRVPFVRQIDEMDCGAAALAMVCRYFGRHVSLPRIRELAHTALDGTSLRSIVDAGTELGLAARAVKLEPEAPEGLSTPAIAHWEGNHWVVVARVRKRYVELVDPASGKRRVPRKEFEEKWSGYAALFDYTPAFEEAPEGRSAWGWALQFVKPFRWTLVQVLLLAVVTSALQLLLPVFTQVIVDRVVVDGDVETLHVIVGAMLVALVFMLGANVLQRFMLSFAAVHIDAAILDHLTRSMLALPMRYFNNRRIGDIQRRLAGAREVREFIVHSGLMALLAVVQLAAYLGLMAVYSGTLLLVFLVTVPFYFGLMFFSRRVLRPLFDRIEQSFGRYQSHQIDSIRGIEAVKASAGEQYFRDRMLNEFLSLARTQFKSNFTILFYESAIQAVGYLSTVLFLWAGAHIVLSGGITIGAFVAFNALVAMAYQPILTILGLWDEFQMSDVLMNRLNDIFEFEPEQGRDRGHLKPVRTLEGQVELRGVDFRYGGPGSTPILKNINLVIPPGKTVAIVGRSGSGKTTLVKLLSGLLEPTRGTLLFDGIEMKTLNYRDLRRHVGLVLQDNYVFDGTILENIALGDQEPDLHRAVWAAETANASDFIGRFPLGYETHIGETGIALSGGQKQRVAIARAVYNNPPVLIFDEATSALDSESERAIQENLSRILSSRTAVVIAHRLSTIRNADQIVVLEKGEIVESGTHEELLKRQGLYFYLHSQQMGV
jgi:ATP-binding cassette subfamily B protein